MQGKDDYQEYMEWERKQNSGWAKFSKQITPVQLTFFLLLILGGNHLMSTGKISSDYFWAGLIAIGVVIIFLILREPQEKMLIPEPIIKQIAYESLNKKKGKIGEIPFDAKIDVMLLTEGIYETDVLSQTSGIIKRDVGFQVITKGFVKTGVISIHPYTGAVMGIRFEKLGYFGKSSKDRIIIPVDTYTKFEPKKE